jgi:hypothetical protein
MYDLHDFLENVRAVFSPTMYSKQKYNLGPVLIPFAFWQPNKSRQTKKKKQIEQRKRKKSKKKKKKKTVNMVSFYIANE